MNIHDFAQAVLNMNSPHKREQAIRNLRHGLQYETKWNAQHKLEVAKLIAFLEADTDDLALLDDMCPIDFESVHPRLVYSIELEQLNDIDNAHADALVKAIKDYNETDGQQDFKNYIDNACPYAFVMHSTSNGYRVSLREYSKAFIGVITAKRVDPKK